MKYKIIHIHSDPKFTFSVDRFNHELFDNHLLYLKARDHLHIEFDDAGVLFDQEKENLDKIVAYISQYDLVVFANLHEYNKEILTKLPKEIKVLWWLFGHEFYSKRLDIMLSKKTLVAVNQDYRIDKKDSLKNYYLFLRRKFSSIYSWYNYKKRIDYILVTSKEEYLFIKKHWLFLPKLILYPFQRKTEYRNLEKKDFIILGNNRNMSNNHLDVIDIVKKSKNEHPFKVKMFLSYGLKKNYYKAVNERIENVSNIEPLTDYLSKEEFNKIYEESSALVINSYRQMALGNIFTGIENNCKIYLNDKNAVKKWLKNEGFHVFSIEDFAKDYERNSLRLSEEEAQHNISKLRAIVERNSYSVFQQKIIKILKE